ncbi:MAG: N-acetylmuramic acid 6-phosphate etherase [Candidatus Gastranaerophilales bacterium]|nr:N-acetylmuramic acid 6-phosphate etherase [Candidatus Gastranaerophilales bacterium]
MNDLTITEKTNPNTINIDISSSFEIAKMINNEDLKVAVAISEKLSQIATAIDIISENFIKGGRLIYFGAGTSGRLGVLDASECPPTFNTPENMVHGVIAGGDKALRYAIEGAEDSCELAVEDFMKLNITDIDTIVSISASGNANYVIEVLRQAKKINARTIAITCNPHAQTGELADINICIETGAEVITGSTRMKAGSAQKMVLNMLSTGAMVKIGKVYKNFMVDVKPTNIKLKDRAKRITAQIAQCSQERAQEVLINNGYNVKAAILQIKYNIDFNKAQNLLYENNGIIRNVFSKYSD